MKILIGYPALLGVLFLSFSQFALAGALQSSSSIPSFGMIASEPQGSIYWTSRPGPWGDYGFESGVITTGADGYGGASHATIETDIVYKGFYAVKMESDGTYKAEVGRYGKGFGADLYSIRNKDDAYYGYAFYLGPGYKLSSWHLIAQLRLMEASIPGVGVGRFCQLELTGDPPRFRLVTNMDDQSYVRHWDDTDPAPQGQWFTLIWHLVAKTDGKLEMWINRDPFGNPGAGEYIGSWSMDLDSGQKWPGPYMCANVYQAAGSPRNWLVVDEMICASTLEDVVDFLTP